MGKIHVKDVVVYKPEGDPLLEAKGIRVDRKGGLEGPVIHDPRLESHDVRRYLQDGHGKLMIGVHAGDELGDIQVAIQFEGPIGKYEHCMAGQNELLGLASGWIKDALSDMAADFEVSLESVPCPHSKTPVAIVEACRILEPDVTATSVTSVTTRVDIEAGSH